SAIQVNVKRSVSVMNRFPAARGAALTTSRARTATATRRFMRISCALTIYNETDGSARFDHRRRRTVGAFGGDCGQGPRARLPGAGAGCSRQLDLPLPAADGVLYDARAP